MAHKYFPQRLPKDIKQLNPPSICMVGETIPAMTMTQSSKVPDSLGG